MDSGIGSNRGVRAAGCALGLALMGVVCPRVEAIPVQVSLTNLAPEHGVFLTPLFVAFHDGNFDTFDIGAKASEPLERLAEDGNTAPLTNAFKASASGMHGGVVGTITEPAGVPVQFDPGNTGSAVFDVSPGANTFFSFASMVIPSNDAFIGNADAMGFGLFNPDGTFAGPLDILVLGTDVLDAGTEQNTETNAAFFDQTMPNSGAVENGVIRNHPGFIGSVGNPGGTPIILGGTSPLTGISFDATAADFSRSGYELARIRVSSVAVSSVPEPSSALLLGIGLVGLLGLARPRFFGPNAAETGPAA